MHLHDKTKIYHCCKVPRRFADKCAPSRHASRWGGGNQPKRAMHRQQLYVASFHLTTQMLCRSRRLQLLTPRSGIGVEGPPARRGAGLAAPGPPTPADAGRGRPLPRAPVTAPLLLLLAPAANDLRRGVPAGSLLAMLLLGVGAGEGGGARERRRLLVARAAFAARAAAASSTAAAKPSSTSNS